ncbi:uncharacterized protein HD556DRAFT_1441103 [Suillus plorans]|uniref:Uncharacterized protein n=1 Tax=Suillus plorans TaxID=116603 RepID=A0A9P7DK86_9AGAM|nr:uncharacterized protein HD556DRAFT_1441103 [Suillus plorans]KAG1796928.1 hypothetical protein HD556DRAFT_1441103 [Suillus plorans]
MSTRRATRAKNAAQHPGLLDLTPKRKCRMKAEVAADRQAKLEVKKEKERANDAGIKRVADYEKNQADNNALADATPWVMMDAGGLALSCAAVERALTLWSTHTLTIKMVRAAKGKNITLPKTLNQSTGKVSSRQTGFNGISWGTSTRAYAKEIVKNLHDDKFNTIIASAMEFSKKSRWPCDDIADDVAEDELLDLDERAQLVDISDTESESKGDGDSGAE